MLQFRLIILSSIVPTLIILFTTHFNTIFIFAAGPTFGQAIVTDEYFQDNVDIGRYISNNTDGFSNLPLDILSTAYTSDGITLHGVSWLSSPLNDSDGANYDRANLTFYMYIQTKWNEPAYEVQIYRGPHDGTWTKNIIQFEPTLLPNKIVRPELVPDPTYRTLESIHNYTGFYENGKRYVDLSLDLNLIGPPKEYKIYVGSEATAANGTILGDSTNIFPVPPTKPLRTIGWPDLIEVRTGGEKTIRTIPINSTELDMAETISFVDANKNDGIDVNFRPQSVKIPVSGVRFVEMEIQAQGGVVKDNSGITNQTVTISSEEFPDIQTNETFNLQILPPVSLPDRLGETLKNSIFTYVTPLAVTAVFAFWLSRRIQINKASIEMIRVKDILTVDASVIAGVLIFLTVGAAFASGEAIQQVGILTASIVFPFAIAAIRTLIKGTVEEYGVKFMIAGFVYLMTSVILIALIQVPERIR